VSSMLDSTMASATVVRFIDFVLLVIRSNR
jgi:hypothetical protein